MREREKNLVAVGENMKREGEKKLTGSVDVSWDGWVWNGGGGADVGHSIGHRIERISQMICVNVYILHTYVCLFFGSLTFFV